MFANVTPFSSATAILAGLVMLAAILVHDSTRLRDDSNETRFALRLYAATLLLPIAIAGWLVWELAISDVTPIPDATISAVVDRLMTTPAATAEAEK